MSCRHYCINSKKSLSKTFSFHKIIYKYFAGFLACIYDIIRCHYEGNARDICPPLASNPICADCFAHARNDRYKKQSRNDEKNIVITREWNARDICGFQPADAPPLASNPICVDCHAFARNDEKNIVITRFCKNRSNPKYMLCFFDNNVASAHCVNNSNRSTQGVRHRRPVGKTPCYKKLDCFASRCVPHSVCFSNGNARNDRYEKQNRIRCAPHGDDDNKNFQFDKFQRLFSVIYKKNSLTKEISK